MLFQGIRGVGESAGKGGDMAQELEHGAGPGAGTDAGAGGVGALPICASGRSSHCDRGSHFDYDCARNRDRIRCAAGGRRLPVGGGSARRSGPVQERAPGRHRLSGGVCVSWGEGYRSSWSRRQDPEQERTREQSLGALATCDCGRYRVCDRGCHYDCGCGHGRGCAHCTGGTRSLPVWERALRVGFGARWLRSDS